MLSLNDVFDFIKAEEEKLKLYDLRLDDTYIWPLLRFKLAATLQTKLGLIQIAHDKPVKETRFERYKKAIIYETKYHFYQKKKSDTVIIPHPRRQVVDGDVVDIYTYAIQAQYPDAMILERSPYNNLGLKNHGLVLLEECVFDKYNKSMQQRIALFSPIYMLEILKADILDQLGLEFDVNDFLKAEWKHFVINELRFEKFLKKFQPKQVILVVGYANYAIIQACKRLEVKVIEVQHGIIDANHLGYHFDYPLPSVCFCDELWLFANYWRLNTALPLSADKIKLIGFSYFHNQVKKLNIARIPNRVIFLSQGTCGEEMVKSALSLARSHPHLDIIYKLHPGEVANYKTRYPDLLTPVKNVKIISNEIPLYELLKSSTYMVGAYSTAIYEGLALGCIGILLDIVGTRTYMQVLINQNLVYITKNLSYDFDFIKSDAYYKEVINIYF